MISAIVARGFGSFGSVNLAVTRGFVIGAAPESPATAICGIRFRRISRLWRRNRG